MSTVELALDGLHGDCRLCGSANVAVIKEGMELSTPAPYPLKGDMQLLICRRCGFVGAETNSGASDYVDYYSHYNKHQTREGELADLDREYFRKVIDFIKSSFSSSFDGARVLDFGSGARLFAIMAKEAGATIASNFDLQAPVSGQVFDLIVTTHCFEHIYNFNDELARIHSMLEKDGLFCIAVPDVRGYLENYYGPYNCFDLEHINHFDYKSLSEALSKNGLAPIAITESERLVTPTLAYPEVIIVAKKQELPVSSQVEYSSSRESVESVIDAYMSRSREDMSAMFGFARNIYDQNKREGIDAEYGFYGLSSYAFRVLHYWDEAEIPLHWLADSDDRLMGKAIRGINIFNFNEFKDHAQNNAERGIKTVCFIAAVNAHRIETFLRSLGMMSLDVFALPPNCQNKGK